MDKKFIKYEFIQVAIPRHHAETLKTALEKVPKGEVMTDKEMKEVKKMKTRLENVLHTDNLLAAMSLEEKRQYAENAIEFP